MKTVNQNELVYGGYVQSVHKKPNVLRITISTSPSRNKRLRDYPTINFFGKHIEEYDDIKEGDHVCVDAVWQTVPRTESKTASTSYIKGVRLTKQVSRMKEELGLDIGHEYEDKNEAIVAGEIVGIATVNEKVTIVTLKAFADGKTSFPRITCFENQHNYVINNVKAGDYLAVLGYTQTKFIREKKIKYETIVARDCHKLEL